MNDGMDSGVRRPYYTPRPSSPLLGHMGNVIPYGVYQAIGLNRLIAEAEA